MKVAYILKYFPKNSETFIHEEIYQLIKKGIDVQIFSLIDCSREKKHSKVNWILKKSKLNSYPWNPENILKNIYSLNRNLFCIPELVLRTDILSLTKDLKKFDPDVIHTHFLFERAELTQILAKKLNKPFTVTMHAKDVFIPNKRRLKKVSHSVKKIITISKFNLKILQQYRIENKKIEIIHCGIDLKNFTLLNKTKKKDIINILSIGRIVESKGFIYLLEAAKILKKQKKKFKIRIVGDGPLEKKLHQYIIQNGLTNEVHFIGRLIDKEVKKEIEKTDFFILPCVKCKNGSMDGIPVVLMEAMARGKTCISTRLTGIPELIKHGKTGYLANPNDSKGLAEIISNAKILNPKIIRDVIQKEFNSEKNAERLINIWKK